MSLFGAAPSQPTQTAPSLFSNLQSTAPQQNNLFGQPQQQTNLFGQTQQQPAATSNLFGQIQQQPAATSNLFGQIQQQPAATSNPFGARNQAQPQSAPNLFQNLGNTQPQQQTSGSSLFANLGTTNQAQQQQGGPSLFAGVGTAQAQQPQAGGSNLFGGVVTGQTQQQQAFGASLFGSTTGQTPQQQTNASSLFGAASGTQQQQQPAPQSAGPLFGASLLGINLGAQPQQLQTQASDGQQVQPGAGTGHGAYFDNLLERGKKRHDVSSGNGHFGELPGLQLGLRDIASKVRHLGDSGRISNSDRHDNSRAQYLLAASGVPRGTISNDLKYLRAQSGATPAPAAVPPADTDIETYVANLRAKSTTDLINEALEQSKRDFDAFLEENIQMNWDEQRARIYEHFGLTKPSERLDDSVDGDSTMNPAVRGAFGQSSRRSNGPDGSRMSRANISYGPASMSKSVLGGTVGRGKPQGTLFADVAENTAASGARNTTEDPSLRNKQEKYAAKVRDLNSARLQGVVYPVIEQFARVEIEDGTDSQKHLVDAYKALKEITKEDGQKHRPSEPGAVKERQYAQEYLDDTINSGRSMAMRKQILEGARKFLEKSFFNGLEELIAKNPHEANTGGVPSKINKVRAYIRLKALRKDLAADSSNVQVIGDDYCWALIFYLLRSGLVKEAAQYVEENRVKFKSMDRHFEQYIASYAVAHDRRLPRELQARITSEYQQRLRTAPDNSIDKYRMACYKIIGRCDLARKSIEGVGASMDDWFWTIFSLAREVNRVDEVAGETFGLEEVQHMVEDIGQRHFSSGGELNAGYATFFLLQILSGSFEHAISYLYSHNYVAAVHFAIALNFYGLLRVSDFDVSESKLLTFTTRQKPQISFSRLLGYYTRDFRLARAEAATDYLTLICFNSDLPGSIGQSQVSVCHEALKELVLETREFAMLLGDIRSDGTRVKGAIEQRLRLISLQNQDDFLRTLTIQAAAVADDSGRTTDAVLLYHLAEEYDNVVAIINRSLSEALSVELGQDPMRLQPLKPRTIENSQQVNQQSNGQQQQQRQQQQPESSLSLTSVDDPAVLARNMITLYNANALYFRKIRQPNREACGTLIRMSTIKDFVEAGRWAEAIDLIESLSLLPLRANGNVSVIRASAQAFNSLAPVVARNIGNLLMWTITCCGRQRSVLRSSAFQANKPMAERLLRIAQDLMVFAGLVRYKLPPDVYEALAAAGNDVGY